MDRVEDRILAVIARQAMLGPDAVTPDARLDQLGLDSLAQVELIFQLEEMFGISIPFDATGPGAEGGALATVADVIAAVMALVDGRG